MDPRDVLERQLAVDYDCTLEEKSQCVFYELFSETK